MIKDLPRYPATKPSGIAGIGDIPAHWKVVLNQRILKEKIRPHNGQPETQLSLSQRQGLVPTSVMEEGSLQTATFENWKVTVPGDLVLNRFKAHLGVFFAATLRGIVSFHYGVFAPRVPLNPKYFEILYHTPAYRSIYAGRSNGMTVGLQNLSNQNFYNVHSIVPPTEEQAAIVRFLDHADRRIRKYIAIKRKLIALLNEQKQVIIHRAVTRGLDLNVRLKTSGVEWLGDVPAHWEVAKLSHWFRTTSGSTPSRGVSGYYGGGIPWVKTGELLDAEIHGAAETITRDGLDAASLALLPVNTLLIAMYGQGKTRGRTGLLKVEATVNQACLAVLPSPKRIIPEYLQLWFISQYPFLRYVSEARNATQPNLNAEIIRNQKIVLPRLAEQEQILSWLRSATATVLAAATRAQQEVTLLHEYRTRLIADVVTGKLDVRQESLRLPEVVDEQELDEVDDVDAVTHLEDGATDDAEDLSQEAVA